MKNIDIPLSKNVLSEKKNLITNKNRIVQPQPMCAKFEYRNLSRYYSTNSATPPYI